jgi:hypothetical protein
MKDFYKKTIEAFEKPENKALFEDKKIPVVDYIDLYAGQDLNEENFELFAQPALLLEWEIDHLSKPPIATITCYCCYEQLRDTSNKSMNREMALKFLDYVELIKDVITTVLTEKTGVPELISEGFNKMDSIVDIYLLTFRCSYTAKEKHPYLEGAIENLQTNRTIRTGEVNYFG